MIFFPTTTFYLTLRTGNQLADSHQHEKKMHWFVHSQEFKAGLKGTESIQSFTHPLYLVNMLKIPSQISFNVSALGGKKQLSLGQESIDLDNTTLIRK